MKKQQGFTLVELMIAGVISVFLLASLMNLFITTNKSISLSEALSENQESGRFALEYMTRFIRLSGFSEDFTASAPPVLISLANAAFSCSNGACSENNPIDAHGDRLAIPYVVSNVASTRSCAGTIVGGPALGQQSIANVFWVSNDPDTEFELQCRTFDYLNNAWIDDAPVSIVAGVESFEFQVGLALDETDRNAGRYVNIDSIINPVGGDINSINQIRSIRIALLTTSQDDLNPNKLKTNKKERVYAILDGQNIVADDGNLRQIFSSTIELPNMIESAALN